jgi:hypothetical protein
MRSKLAYCGAALAALLLTGYQTNPPWTPGTPTPSGTHVKLPTPIPVKLAPTPVSHALILTCNPPAKVELEYSPKPEVQERTYWCWAASGKLMMNAVRPGAIDKQCDEANRVYGKDAADHSSTTNCCDPSACDLRGKPPYDIYQFQATTVSTENNQALLLWDAIRDQLGCKNKPVTLVWKRKDKTKHMAVIVGYWTDDQGVGYVWVNDPEVGTDLVAMTYQAYLGGDLSTHDQVLVSNDYDLVYKGP